MTEQDVLNMDKSRDIMRALANTPELWSQKTSDHLKNIKRKENVERFGDPDILYTPPKQQ